MKKHLLKTVTLSILIAASNLSQAQTWDSIISGINKYTFNQQYPACNEVLVVNGQNVLAATLTGVYKSSNYGNSWSKLTIPGPTSSFVGDGYVGVRKVNNNRILALGMGGLLGNSIAKSDDGGNTWAASFTGIAPSVIVEDLSVAPNGNIFIATRISTGSPAIYMSTDNGDTWVIKNNGLTSVLWSVVVLNNTTILAGASDGIYKSTDSGNSWTNVKNTSSSSSYVVCLKKNNAGVIYAGLAAGSILKSTDNGTTWTSINLVNGGSVYEIEFDSNNNIYICKFLDGVYKFNSSETLISVIGNATSGMQNTKINDLTIDESGASPVVFASAGVSGAGCIYRLGSTSAVGIEESTKIDFSLSPNPAQQSIQIQGLNVEEGVQVKIISIEGKLMKNEIVNQANYSVSELTPGMYFMQLTNNEGKIGVIKFLKE